MNSLSATQVTYLPYGTYLRGLMALVDYPDSDSGSEAGSCAQPAECHDPSQAISTFTLNKRKRDEDDSKRDDSCHTPPPPLPVGFHDLYASGIKTSVADDPSLHGGRQRLTPHVPGSWATHVYLECKSSVDQNIGHEILWERSLMGWRVSYPCRIEATTKTHAYYDGCTR